VGGACSILVMEVLQGVALIAATLTMGLMAGVFSLYSHAIMPGLRRTDDRTFVGAFQAIDRAIINPWFMPMFFGALVFTAIAAALLVGEGAVLPWTLAALVLYLVTFLITIRVNVPLNDAIKAAGDPDELADLAGVRRRFDEDRWARMNLIRSITTTIALGCLTWALVEYGRVT
jgi:uncharacterized membrane protein